MNTELSFDYGAMKPVSMDDMEEIQRSLALSGYPSCEYSFPNLYIWAEVYGTVRSFFNGRLYVHMPSVDELLFPCGEKPVPVQKRENDTPKKTATARNVNIAGVFDRLDEIVLEIMMLKKELSTSLDKSV